MQFTYLLLLILFFSHLQNLPPALAEAGKPIEAAEHQIQDFSIKVRAQAEETSSALQLTRRLVADMEKLEGEMMPQEEHAQSWRLGKYVTPNEVYGTYFEPCLPKTKGAYISVGTIRALNAGASGKVSHLILFDFDHGIKLANLVLLQCAALSQDRYEFMSLFFKGYKDKERIREGREERLSPEAFLQRLYDKKDQGKLLEGWKASGISLPQESDWQKLGLGNKYYNGFEDDVRFGIGGSLSKFRKAGTLKDTFFEDETRFQALRRLVLDHKVTLITGDLSREKGAFSSLGKTLREKNIPVSALDISNSNDYFNHGSLGHLNFYRNLLRLPFGSEGRLLLTDSHLGRVPDLPDVALQDSWAYFAVTVSKLGEMGRWIAAGDYRQALEDFHPDPSPHNKHKVLLTRENDRCEKTGP